MISPEYKRCSAVAACSASERASSSSRCSSRATRRAAPCAARRCWLSSTLLASRGRGPLAREACVTVAQAIEREVALLQVEERLEVAHSPPTLRPPRAHGSGRSEFGRVVGGGQARVVGCRHVVGRSAASSGSDDRRRRRRRTVSPGTSPSNVAARPFSVMNAPGRSRPVPAAERAPGPASGAHERVEDARRDLTAEAGPWHTGSGVAVPDERDELRRAAEEVRVGSASVVPVLPNTGRLLLRRAAVPVPPVMTPRQHVDLAVPRCRPRSPGRPVTSVEASKTTLPVGVRRSSDEHRRVMGAAVRRSSTRPSPSPSGVDSIAPSVSVSTGLSVFCVMPILSPCR